MNREARTEAALALAAFWVSGCIATMRLSGEGVIAREKCTRNDQVACTTYALELLNSIPLTGAGAEGVDRREEATRLLATACDGWNGYVPACEKTESAWNRPLGLRVVSSDTAIHSGPADASATIA